MTVREPLQPVPHPGPSPCKTQTVELPCLVGVTAAIRPADGPRVNPPGRGILCPGSRAADGLGLGP